jgi:hypothetical protein
MRVGSLIGLGAGLASALLFYSAARGSPLLGAALLVLTPLPTLLAGFGWGWLPAAVGAVAGAGAMAVFADPAFACGFGLALGVPAMLATYLAYLSRPNRENPSVREFYPPGHLVAAMALYAGLLPMLILPLIGGSYHVLTAPLTDFYARLAAKAGPELGLPTLRAEEIAALAEWTIILLPGVFAAYWLAIFTLNLYLAGRIARASGRLGRDWPDLAAMSFPGGFPLLAALALAAAFLPGLPAVAGRSFTGGLLFAFLLAGLALLHYLARGRAPWVLWLVYGALLAFGPYAALAITLGGLLDATFQLKRRLGTHPPAT